METKGRLCVSKNLDKNSNFERWMGGWMDGWLDRQVDEWIAMITTRFIFVTYLLYIFGGSATRLGYRGEPVRNTSLWSLQSTIIDRMEDSRQAEASNVSPNSLVKECNQSELPNNLRWPLSAITYKPDMRIKDLQPLLTRFGDMDHDHPL